MASCVPIMSTAIDLRAEWHPSEGIIAPELAATFCRLEMWLGDQCLTRVEDKRAGGIRTGIYCSAYPLAEWLATHWWILRQNVRYNDRAVRQLEATPTDEAIPYDDRHDLRGANDGFIWPACTIIPEGEQSFVAWRARPGPSSEPIAYLSSGTAYVETNALSESFAGFIDAVIARLVAHGITQSVLQDEWHAISSADDQEAAFCNAAAALGLDPYDLDPRHADLLEALGKHLGDSVVLELARAADLRLLADDSRWLADAERSLATRSLSSSELAPFRGALSGATWSFRTPPFIVGWDHARLAREALGWDPDNRADVESFVDLDRQHVEDAALLGAAMIRSDTLALRVSSEGDTTARFVAGRALWRGLHESPDKPFLITNAGTWSHKVERAFAAELLAPAEGIRKLIGETQVIDNETLYSLSTHFTVTPTLIRHQLENQLGAAVAY